MLYCLFLLLGAAITVLFWAEESETSCGIVSAMLACCSIGLLVELGILPLEAILGEGGWGLRRRGVGLAGLLIIMLTSAVFYGFVSRFIYPLRDKLMEAFDRRYSKKR